MQTLSKRMKCDLGFMRVQRSENIIPSLKDGEKSDPPSTIQPNENKNEKERKRKRKQNKTKLQS